MRAAGRAMAGEDGEPVSVVTVRVQYLEDSDPFACANFPEPRRAPICSLDGALPLSTQIPALHRLLGAPLKVRELWTKVGVIGGIRFRTMKAGRRYFFGRGCSGCSPPEKSWIEVPRSTLLRLRGGAG